MTNHVCYKIEEIVCSKFGCACVCSDIISDEPMLHLKCLHIYKPIACMGKYKDE